MSSFRLSKCERISARSEIRAVFKQGNSFKCKGATLFVLPNCLPYNRFVCTFRKNFGSAVLRNRIRRVSKEVFRHTKAQLPQGYDLVLVVYSRVGTFEHNAEQFLSLCRIAGLLPREITS